MANEYSVEIAAAIKNFLDTDDWHYSFDSEDGIFNFTLQIGKKIKKLAYKIKVRKDDFTVYTIAPIGPNVDDAEEMANMGEYLHRANYGLINGNFEFDYDDGEIRYKSFVDCEDQIPSNAVIQNSIYLSANSFKRYSDGMVDIIFGGKSAKDAYEKCKQEYLNSVLEMMAQMQGDDDSSDDD